jgi:hypothetical protein
MTKDAKDDLEAVRLVATALQPFDDNERQRIIRWACEKLGVAMEASAHSIAALPPKPNSVAELAHSELKSSSQGRDIKSFIAEKDPKNDRQLAAVVAYYHAFEAPQTLRKTSIDQHDITEACRLAGRHRPKAGQTLINAAQSGFLDKAEESGKYKLNAVGENLVAMALPGNAEGRRSAKKRTKQLAKTKKKARSKRG